MTRPRNIWDSVWGQIELTEEEWELINTPAFQRLRRIHQLAMTMLVFPGATHTRFEHSLGTFHVADRIGRRLVHLANLGESDAFTDGDARLTRLASLLHDIGHGPFSHVADPFLNASRPHGHEWIGAMAITQMPELRDVVDRVEPGTSSAIADLLLGRGPRSVRRDIVSGPTDADKIDYLMRDSQHTGVRGGHFDHDYLIDQLIAIESIGESWLGFRANGVWAVEGLKLARYHMFRTVYTHRNRLVTDLMLGRALRDGLGAFLPAELLTLPDEAAFNDWFARYLAFDDWNVFARGVEDDGRSGRMFRRLRDHRLLKVLVFVEGEEFKRLLGTEYARRLLANRETGFEHDCEAPLAAGLGLDPEDVIVYLVNPDHVLHRDPLRLDEDINFKTSDGEIQAFVDRSEIFSAAEPERWRRQLVVYADRSRKEDPHLATRAKVDVIEQLKTKLAEGA